MQPIHRARAHRDPILSGPRSTVPERRPARPSPVVEPRLLTTWSPLLPERAGTVWPGRVEARRLGHVQHHEPRSTDLEGSRSGAALAQRRARPDGPVQRAPDRAGAAQTRSAHRRAGRLRVEHLVRPADRGAWLAARGARRHAVHARRSGLAQRPRSTCRAWRGRCLSPPRSVTWSPPAAHALRPETRPYRGSHHELRGGAPGWSGARASESRQDMRRPWLRHAILYVDNVSR